MKTMEETVVTMKPGQEKPAKMRKEIADMPALPEFDAVYRRYLHPVYAFIAYRVSGQAIAEDITAQVFEKAWRSYAGFDPRRASASTWIFTIARNCLADHFRKSGRAQASVLYENTVDTAGVGSDPVAGLEALELSSELKTALDNLKAQEREIISLKFGASMTNRDIGKLLGISESSVGTTLYRSLRKLKTTLEGGIEND